MSAEPRSGLRDVEPYISPQLDVAAKLNTNESPYPLPEGFSEDLARAVRDLPLNRYPDGGVRALRDAVADAETHEPDGTWVANGSNEILLQLLQAYGGTGRTALMFEPTYLLHSRIAWLTQTESVRLRLPDDFRLGPDQVAQAVDAEPNVVFVCSPNNPTGNAQPVDAIAELAEGLPAALVVVDEAYVEFAPGRTALGLVSEHSNVAVVRTFSKAFALAGARIGYALAGAEVVRDLERVRLPYHVSALTQAAGMTALRHREEAREILGEICEQRDRIASELARVDGVRVHRSDANFVLFEPPGDASSIWQGLLDRGVLVRDMTALVPGALRVTSGTEHEVDLFLKALTEVLRA